MCFYYLKTARCICHFEFLSCLSFLTENSNTIIITAFAQNCDGLDSNQSLVETGKMPSICIFSLHKLHITR